MSFSHQLRTVRRLKVPEGVSRRYNCPFCDGYNTLGVSNINGVLEWNCFKASCPAKGIYDEGSSLEGISARLADNVSKSDGTGKSIPDMLISVRQPEHVEWLKEVHSYQALTNKLADIVYSPSEDRILFSVSNGKGYTGRRMSKYGPKWIKYGDTSNLFACGTGRTGVLVEDAPSACAVGVIPEYTGLSLLGTNLTSQHKINLLTYDKILVCLDPDAARKGVDLSDRINGIRPSLVKLIPDDLKYYNPDEIKEILK